jgi:branched-chain amino acid transport system permease protein
MGMGGGIWAQYNLAFDPKQFFFTQTFNILAMIVVGGLASVSGAVIGAATVTLTTEIMRRVEESAGIPGLTQMVVALLILLVLYRRPDGLVGRSEVDDLLGRRLHWPRPARR